MGIILLSRYKATYGMFLLQWKGRHIAMSTGKKYRIAETTNIKMQSFFLLSPPIYPFYP
jgi:hypothetical protein